MVASGNAGKHEPVAADSSICANATDHIGGETRAGSAIPWLVGNARHGMPAAKPRRLLVQRQRRGCLVIIMSRQ